MIPPSIEFAIREAVTLLRLSRRNFKSRQVEQARELLARLVRYPAWSMAQFDAARERLYARYPTITDLWRSLA